MLVLMLKKQMMQQKLVVAFDDEIGTASASSFEVTTDAGAVLTPTAVEIGTKGTDAAGASFDKKKCLSNITISSCYI